MKDDEMKKGMKLVLIIALALAVLGAGGLAALILAANEKNANYYKYATPFGEIEKRYTAPGAYPVSSIKFNGGSDACGKYLVWYPQEMKEARRAYPLVVMANGTGTKASRYGEVLEHLASWGFIVAGNEDENSRTGASSAETLDLLLRLNNDRSSAFYGKIDTENIGIAGHSQGGVGAINAVTGQPNGRIYKTVAALSATSRFHADELNKSNNGWSCDLSKLKIPVFMAAGTGPFDAGNMDEYSEGTLPEGRAQGICPLWWLRECHEAVPKTVNIVIARQVGKDHGDMLHSADGYMTAWFMYWLQGDEAAGNAFWGENAEICSNPNWQDVEINQP